MRFCFLNDFDDDHHYLHVENKRLYLFLFKYLIWIWIYMNLATEKIISFSAEIVDIIVEFITLTYLTERAGSQIKGVQTNERNIFRLKAAKTLILISLWNKNKII